MAEFLDPNVSTTDPPDEDLGRLLFKLRKARGEYKTPADELEADAQARGLTVTSKNTGTHVPNSAHYDNRAVDIRTKDQPQSLIDQYIAEKKAQGYKVLDERVNPASSVSRGPHVHLQAPRGGVPAQGDQSQPGDQLGDILSAVRQKRQSSQASQQRDNSLQNFMNQGGVGLADTSVNTLAGGGGNRQTLYDQPAGPVVSKPLPPPTRIQQQQAEKVLNTPWQENYYKNNPLTKQELQTVRQQQAQDWANSTPGSYIGTNVAVPAVKAATGILAPAVSNVLKYGARGAQLLQTGGYEKDTPVDTVANAIKSGGKNIVQGLDNSGKVLERADPVSRTLQMAGEGAGTLGAFAGAGLLGGPVAEYGLLAASQDWDDPKKAAINTLLNAAMMVTGGKLAKPSQMLGEEVMLATGKPALGTAANVLARTLANAGIGGAGSVATQALTNEPGQDINYREALKQAAMGGAFANLAPTRVGYNDVVGPKGERMATPEVSPENPQTPNAVINFADAQRGDVFTHGKITKNQPAYVVENDGKWVTLEMPDGKTKRILANSQVANSGELVRENPGQASQAAAPAGTKPVTTVKAADGTIIENGPNSRISGMPPRGRQQEVIFVPPAPKGPAGARNVIENTLRETGVKPPDQPVSTPAESAPVRAPETETQTTPAEAPVEASPAGDLYSQVKDYANKGGELTPSALQKQFKIGYGDASQLIDRINSEKAPAETVSPVKQPEPATPVVEQTPAQKKSEKLAQSKEITFGDQSPDRPLADRQADVKKALGRIHAQKIDKAARDAQAKALAEQHGLEYQEGTLSKSNRAKGTPAVRIINPQTGEVLHGSEKYFVPNESRIEQPRTVGEAPEAQAETGAAEGAKAGPSEEAPAPEPVKEKSVKKASQSEDKGPHGMIAHEMRMGAPDGAGGAVGRPILHDDNVRKALGLDIDPNIDDASPADKKAYSSETHQALTEAMGVTSATHISPEMHIQWAKDNLHTLGEDTASEYVRTVVRGMMKQALKDQNVEYSVAQEQIQGVENHLRRVDAQRRRDQRITDGDKLRTELEDLAESIGLPASAGTRAAEIYLAGSEGPGGGAPQPVHGRTAREGADTGSSAEASKGGDRPEEAGSVRQAREENVAEPKEARGVNKARKGEEGVAPIIQDAAQKVVDLVNKVRGIRSPGKVSQNIGKMPSKADFDEYINTLYDAVDKATKDGRVEVDPKNPAQLSAKAAAKLKDNVQALATAWKNNDRAGFTEAQRQMHEFIWNPKYKVLHDLFRPIMLSGEYSFAMIQGGIAAMTHPFVWSKSMAKATAAGFDPMAMTGIKGPKAFKEFWWSHGTNNFDKFIFDISHHRLAKEAAQDKLQLDSLADIDLKKSYSTAEGYAASFIQKLPLIKQTEIAMKVFLDSLRLQYYEQAHDMLTAKGFTRDANPELFKDAARTANIFSGRGDFGPIESSVPLINNLGLAPRFVLAQFQQILSGPKVLGENLTRGVGNTYKTLRGKQADITEKAFSNPVDMKIMRDYAKILGVSAGAAALATAAGWEIPLDPDDPKFLMAKPPGSINGYSIVPSGWQPQLKFMGRLIKRIVDNQALGGPNTMAGTLSEMGGDVAHYARSKAGIIPSLAIDTGTQYRENKYSPPVSPDEDLTKLRDKNLVEEGLKKGMNYFSPGSFDKMDKAITQFGGYGTNYVNKPVNLLDSITNRLAPVYANQLLDDYLNPAMTSKEEATRAGLEFFGYRTQGIKGNYSDTGRIDRSLHKEFNRQGVQLYGVRQDPNESDQAYGDRVKRINDLYNEYGPKLLDDPTYKEADKQTKVKMLESFRKRVSDFNEGLANKQDPNLDKLEADSIMKSIETNQKHQRSVQRRRLRDNYTFTPTIPEDDL